MSRNFNKFKNSKEKIILTKYISTFPVGRAYGYYKNLGYNVESSKKEISVNIQDLPRSSNARVEVVCPLCKERRIAVWNEVVAANHTYCNPCARAYNLVDVKFNSLTVVEYSGRKDGSIAWKCVCDCGETVITTSDHLVNGNQKSCGCSRIGENNSLWDDGLTQAERIKKRATFKFYRFRRKVLKSTPNQCYICKNKKGIEIHHLYSVRHFPEKMYDSTNAVILCKKHHYNFHGFMGGTRNPCTPSDFFEWINSLNKNK